MKKLLLILTIGIFLIGTISALDFAIDNYRVFDKEASKYGKITVWDTGQIGDDKQLASYVLERNSDYCLVNCYAEGTATLNYDGKLFTKLEFENIDGKKRTLNKEKIYIMNDISYEEDVYETTCTPTITANGTGGSCSREKTGTKTINSGSWEEYYGQTIEAGTYKWRVEGEKSRTESIDWIPTSFGEKFEEWAWWNVNWNSKKQINITGAASTDILNYTTYFLVEKEPGMQADYDDLRFLNASEDAELPFEVDWQNSSGAGVWVKIQNLTGAGVSNTTIYMYYNNSAATNGEDWDNTWGEDAVGIYHMQTVTVVNDSSISHNNMTMDAGVILNTSGAFGNQITLPGLSGGGFKGESAKNEFGISGDSPFTVVMKFNAFRVASAGMFYELGTDTIEQGVNFASVTAGPQWRVAGFTGAANFGSEDTQDHWAIMSHDGTNVELFLDGDKDFTASPTLALDNNTIIVGGNHIGDQFNNVTIDEFQVYNASLGSSWFNRTLQLNNSNYYIFGGELNVSGEGVSSTTTLDSPDDNIQKLNRTTFFVANFTSANGNLSNASLTVWDLGGVVAFTNFTTINGTSNQSNLSLLLTPGNYTWNYEGCADNLTASNCSTSTSNRTLNIMIFNETAQAWVNETGEGVINNFEINITTDSLGISFANLFYNNTNFSGTVTNPSGSDFSINTDVESPFVGTRTNISFYWDIILSEGSRDNSTMNNQTIIALEVDDCTGNNKRILNLTLNDEENDTRFGDDTVISNVEIDLTLSTLDGVTELAQFNKTFINQTDMTFCIPDEIINDSTYRMDFITEYNAFTTAYAIEFFELENYTLNSSTMDFNVTLRDLLLADSTTFITQFKDESDIAQAGVLITALRQYIGEGIFKIVENGRTNDDGETSLHLVEEDVIYRFNVSKNGTQIYLSSEYRVDCVTGERCTITLRALGGVSDFPDDWDNLASGQYNISSNQTSRIITLAFLLSETTEMNLTVFQYSNNQSQMDTLIGENTSTFGPGTNQLTFFVPLSYGNKTFYSVIYADNNFVNSHNMNLRERAQDYFGPLSAFLAGIVLLTIALIAVSQGIGMIIWINVGMIAIVALAIIDMPNGLWGPMSVVMYFLTAGALIIYQKYRRDRRE